MVLSLPQITIVSKVEKRYIKRHVSRLSSPVLVDLLFIVVSHCHVHICRKNVVGGGVVYM